MLLTVHLAQSLGPNRDTDAEKVDNLDSVLHLRDGYRQLKRAQDCYMYTIRPRIKPEVFFAESSANPDVTVKMKWKKKTE